MRALFHSILCLLAATAQITGRQAYNEIYASKPEYSKAEPNAFLVRTIQGRKPGRALDVAMGPGRNALWLASQGWKVTGFDVSDGGIAEAQEHAKEQGLSIETFVSGYEQFDWGKDKWDLILFSCFLPKDPLPKVWDALKPGGLIVVEGFHNGAARIRPLGGGYRGNELSRVFERYRVLIYEDAGDRQDWGRQYGETNRLVRVLAQKRIPNPPGCVWDGRSYLAGETMCWGAQWKCGGEGWEWSGKCDGATADDRLRLIVKSADDWNRGDIEAFVQCYEQTPETTFVGATVTHGAEDILARYRRNYPDRARMGKLTFSELQARTLSGTLAIVTGRFTLERAAEAGGQATGLFTLVLRRGPNGWRIIHDHTSPP
jgi:SAM-dependent methyltransferase/ketosteroid isomerase-like protein